MMKRIKLKINGESPRSLFLAFFLARLKCDIYVYDFLSNSKKDCQILLFSNFSKNLFSKFDIWNEIEDISYGFTSVSFKDSIVSEQLLFRTKNFSKKYFNTLGWTANYSDIKNLLLNRLINSGNVHFISNNQLMDKSLIFDYQFNFKCFDKRLNLFKLPLPCCKGINEQILTFNVYLRGHVEKRLYEINTAKGFFVLIPLNKNMYQIIWKNAPSQIIETSLSSKSFFLDNLSILLPNEIKVDEIIGDINSMYISNNYSTNIIKNNSIYVNENKFISNPLYVFNFDIIIKFILRIYNFLENNNSRNINLLSKVGLSYLIRKFIELYINYSLYNTLLNLLSVNNIFSSLLRKILFNLDKRISFIKFLIIRILHSSCISNLIN